MNVRADIGLSRSITTSIVSVAAIGFALSAHAQSEWGADDEIGAMNYLTAETVLQTSKLIKEGKVYSLGMTVSRDTPAFRHRYFHIETMQPEQEAFGENEFTYLDDQIIGWTGVGSQINGLAHYGKNNEHYNGKKTSEFLTVDGVEKLGLENIPPMVTRDMLIDMRHYYKSDIVEADVAFNREEIDKVAENQGVSIKKGDVVLFCTGWAHLMGQDNERYLAGGPGIGVEGARYLAEKGMVAIGADNWAFEAVPHENPKLIFHVNQMFAINYGVYAIESILCEELAEDVTYEFMFVLGYPKYK
jgi:kynurenine formamidase